MLCDYEMLKCLTINLFTNISQLFQHILLGYVIYVYNSFKCTIISVGLCLNELHNLPTGMHSLFRKQQHSTLPMLIPMIMQMFTLLFVAPIVNMQLILWKSFILHCTLYCYLYQIRFQQLRNIVWSFKSLLLIHTKLYKFVLTIWAATHEIIDSLSKITDKIEKKKELYCSHLTDVKYR